MENHHFNWENPLEMAIFNSHVELPRHLELPEGISYIPMTSPWIASSLVGMIFPLKAANPATLTTGCDHFSTTRMDQLNYASQAAAAGDLGGIEAVRKRRLGYLGWRFLRGQWLVCGWETLGSSETLLILCWEYVWICREYMNTIMKTPGTSRSLPPFTTG